MGKTAFIFPGQGTQTPGMGMDFYQNFNSSKKIFDMAGDTVKNLCFEGPQEALNITVNTQPCLFAVELACAGALNEYGIYAEGVAGFSLGEVTGAVHCGLLDEARGFDFISLRAKAMNECSVRNKGGMAAVIGLSADKIIDICSDIDGVYPANFNYGKQTVVSFSEQAREALEKSVDAHGGAIVKLAVSGAFHSPLMNEAAKSAAEYLKYIPFGKMTIPVYSNSTAQIYDNPADLLSKQIKSPVLWQMTIENMIQDGFDAFIEAGPGKTLTGMIRKISKDVRTFNVFDMETLESTVKQCKQ